MADNTTKAEGTPENQHSNNAVLAEVPSYSVGDKVISSSKYSNGQCGVVRRLSEYGVHVRFEDGMFEVFHFKPTHHKQTAIQCLVKALLKAEY